MLKIFNPMFVIGVCAPFLLVVWPEVTSPGVYSLYGRAIGEWYSSKRTHASIQFPRKLPYI